jgi:hypothetical protein
MSFVVPLYVEMPCKQHVQCPERLVRRNEDCVDSRAAAADGTAMTIKGMVAHRYYHRTYGCMR